MTVTHRPRTGIWLFPDASVGELVDAVIRSEEAGIDEIWIADEGVTRDPMIVFGAAARATTRIRMGIGITSPVLRHPGALGASIATLDELSDGRAILGLGLGGSLSLGPFGLTFDRPVARMRDAIRIARAVTNRRSVEGYEVPAHASPARSVPIFVASRGEQINRLASREADGVFLSGFAPSAHAEPIEWARSVRPIHVALYASARFRSDAPDPAALRGSPAEIARQLADLVDTHLPESIGLALVDGDGVRAMLDRAFETIGLLQAR